METRDRWGSTGPLKFEPRGGQDLLALRRLLVRREQWRRSKQRGRAMDKALGHFKDGRVIRPVAA
jgi:hypothetical protein